MITYPRGIEVLVNKAACDPAFKTTLLTDRFAAVTAIGLELTPGERSILAAIPASQLERIIEKTTVPPNLTDVFRGYIAAAMLAALGIGIAGCIPVAGGARPDTLPPHDQHSSVTGPSETPATASTAETVTGDFEFPHNEGHGLTGTGTRPDLP